MQIKPNTKNKFEYFTCVEGWVENGNILLLKGDKVKFLERDNDAEDQYSIEVIDGFCTGIELCMTAKQFIKHLEYTFIQKCK